MGQRSRVHFIQSLFTHCFYLHSSFYLSHDGWLNLRVGTSETNSSLRIQPQACSLCAHLLTTLHSYTRGLVYSKFMKQQQLYAVFLVADRCAVAEYFDLGLAVLAPSTAFQLACARQKTSSQEMH